ncbi:MAG: hypothetical protein COA42_14685 [Alteromonadaceae bacterium]|nr:MAG: hypothetical protein COA42_14685 [Alteromonadaceae bacterium]
MRFFQLLFSLFLFISCATFAEPKIEKLLKDNWLEVKSENFTIITDANQKKAKLLVKDLESFRYFISNIMNTSLAPSKPLTVIAISSKKNFKRLDLPEFWAGVFLAGKYGDLAVANIVGYSGSQQKKSWGNQILMHEYVHFINKSVSTSVVSPLWHQEGEAEYLGSFRLEKGGRYATIGDMSVIGDRLYSILNNHGNRYQEIDIEDLLKTTSINMSWRRQDKSKQKRKDEKEAGKFYARSMLAFHYFNSEKHLSTQLSAYLTLINNGKSVDYAFSNSFETSYEEMDKEIIKYISGKTISKLSVDLEKMGVKFPEITFKIRKLDDSALYSYLLQPILRFNSYSLAEKDRVLALADTYAPDDLDTQLAKIKYLVMSSYYELSDLKKSDKKEKKKLKGLTRSIKQISLADANDDLGQLLEKYPNNADILATKAYINLDLAMRKIYVGHPDAKSSLTKLRNLARKALAADPLNGLAYYVLGIASTDSGELRGKFLTEASGALDSAKYLLGAAVLKEKFWNEIEVNILVGNSEAVLALSRQYRTVNSNEWITEGYGRFFIEALETRASPFTEVAKSGASSIQYEDGSTYSGEIKGALPHGKGKLTTYFGAAMSGTWSNGYLENQGEFIGNNQYRYSGNFQEGHITGVGEINYPEGLPIKRSKGEFLMAMEHGEHTFEYSDGRVYSGFNRIGNRHGETTLYKDGEEVRKLDQVLGAYRQKVGDNLIFTGSMNEKSQPDSWGSCYDLKEDLVWHCQFIDGKLNAKAVKSTSIPR